MKRGHGKMDAIIIKFLGILVFGLAMATLHTTKCCIPRQRWRVQKPLSFQVKGRWGSK